MTSSVLRAGIGAGLLAVSTSAHAATPMSLPFADFLPQGAAIDLPLPPPPSVPRPDPTQMRLVIKPRPARGCEPEETRRSTDRHHAASWETTGGAVPTLIRLG